MKKNLLTVNYNIIADSFDLYTSNDAGDSWDCIASYQCKSLEKPGVSNPSTDLIHYGLIMRINSLVKQGYYYGPFDITK